MAGNGGHYLPVYPTKAVLPAEHLPNGTTKLLGGDQGGFCGLSQDVSISQAFVTLQRSYK